MGSDNELKAAVNNWLITGLAAAEHNMKIVKIVKRYSKSLNVGDDCMEK